MFYSNEEQHLRQTFFHFVFKTLKDTRRGQLIAKLSVQQQEKKQPKSISVTTPPPKILKNIETKRLNEMFIKNIPSLSRSYLNILLSNVIFCNPFLSLHYPNLMYILVIFSIHSFC